MGLWVMLGRRIRNTSPAQSIVNRAIADRGQALDAVIKPVLIHETSRSFGLFDHDVPEMGDSAAQKARN